jgi:hypothetical protein
MTIAQQIRARRIIAKVAKQQGISTAKCRADMIEAIRAARLVEEGRVPTPEEFIILISQIILDKLSLGN